MSGIAAGIVGTLLELTFASMIVIAVAALLDLALRRAPWPELRVVPWLLVLVRLALPPGFASPFALADGILPGSGGAPVSAVAGGIAPPAGDSPLIDIFLALLWLAGVVVIGRRVLRRHRAERERRLALALPAVPERWLAAAHAARARLGLRRLPRLIVVPGIPGPFVLGALHPVVVLPERLPGECAARREHLLLHELAHVKRGDPLLGGFATLLSVIFWFHPLLGWVRRRLALAVELCADAEAARALGPAAPAYRSTLLAVAARAHGLLPAGALGFIARRAAILERLGALERPCAGPRGAARGAAVLLALILAATVLPLRGTAETERASAPSSGSAGGSAAVAATLPRVLPDHPGCLLDRYTILGAIAAAGGPSAEAPAVSMSSVPR
jgi:beta-lactamase regulating signal transducer with metallopeptidase domain